MATVTASNVVSRSACFNYQGRTEVKMNSSQINLNSQAFSYVGLRSLNKLHVQTTRATKKSSSSLRASNKDLVKIVCGNGMNLVFVGAEMGPWSKTGGLGDVLGGLPPALAVSAFQLPIYHPFHTQLFPLFSFLEKKRNFFIDSVACFYFRSLLSDAILW